MVSRQNELNTIKTNKDLEQKYRICTIYKSCFRRRIIIEQTKTAMLSC